MNEVILIKTVIVVAVIAISTSIHELCHALVAFKLGDPTAYKEGRITLNPLKHIDPFLTVLLPLALFIGSNGRFTFGAAKPVPINHFNFKNPSIGLALSAGVGPLSNFILSVVGVITWIMLYKISPQLVPADSYNAYLLFMFVWLNFFLGLFNLIPIPPVDGSRIFRLALPRRLQDQYDSIGFFFGLFLILALNATGALNPLFNEVGRLLSTIIISVFGVEYWNDLVRTINS